jgi:transmembrane 9 superfamily protein 2/4
MMPLLTGLFTIVLGLCVSSVDGFYLPGVAPESYADGDEVVLKVNKLSSTHTLLPFDYYSLKFCKPDGGVKPYGENLGEFLRGDRIENSAYAISMLQDENCRVLCQVTLKKKEKDEFDKAVANKYHHNWLMDNLPAASILDDDQYVTTEYVGFPVGYSDSKAKYLYNHVNIIIEYHTVSPGQHRIVGFYVEPLSIKHSFFGDVEWDGKGTPPSLSSCSSIKRLSYEDIKKNNAQKVAVGKVVYTYGVEWRASDVKWASRWDVYLSMNHAVSDKVHWFSIANSIMIVLFLSFMIGMILYRALHRDISQYNRLPTDEEKADEKEETGWKLVHADVFRPPVRFPMVFCVIVGTGAQLTACALWLIIFSAIGFISPANRGSIMMGMLLLFVLMGSLAGYVSARLYKSFKGKQWQRCTLLTALLIPGTVFTVFVIMDLVVWSYGSTGAVPILSMLAIMAMWFGISVPLVFLGAYFGYKQDMVEYPCKTSNIPREIPEQQWYLSPTICCLLGGVLPFGACFVELFFIMSSIWMDQYYYVFGFLLFVYVILAITCAEITAVMCYFHLCSENYHWWWRSLFTAGSTAFYVMMYSVAYFNRLESTMPVTIMLYFGYMLLICLGVFLITGTVGFASCLLFNCAIYSSIKVD